MQTFHIEIIITKPQTIAEEKGYSELLNTIKQKNNTETKQTIHQIKEILKESKKWEPIITSPWEKNTHNTKKYVIMVKLFIKKEVLITLNCISKHQR
jgi:hypothetical protein